ncbi:MAG TPA: fused response regulator/phosphatase [Thermoanaerobaculia bacterium]|jgi:serine phosphatase RsbU (regulator of sigma subunit)|nr:fused response regulator/phosphatase [Thermoanaerobaculia bacterium]
MPDALPAHQRIILIDDSANDLQVTRRFLERRDFDVSAATSGEEGLALAHAITPAAFVIDYRMPVMDGFEVTRRIKADPVLQTIPVLLLTGAGSVQTVVDGLDAGADDFVTKGSDTEILLARLRALLRMKRYQDQLRKLNQQITRDLQIARRVQEALMPNGSFRGPRIEIRSAYIPSETLSGDFYDYFLQDDLLYLFVADVSGHGLPASILVALLKSYIHTEADAGTPLSSFMTNLNDFLFSVSLPTQFATALLFRIDSDGALVYSNAAHPPFLLFRQSIGKTVIHEFPSHLLGAMPSMVFEENRLQVAAGDTLFAYTDGLTDRRNASGDFYSIDRIAALMDDAGDSDLTTLYDRIYEDVSTFAATEELHDDIAFVVTRFH